MDLLKDLNEAQRAAVEYIDGPSLVIAGAGSGKTRAEILALRRSPRIAALLAAEFAKSNKKILQDQVGGVVGAQWGGSITGCSSSATVKGMCFGYL